MIINAIEKIIKKFYKKDWESADFLTEDDVRCHLFTELQQGLRKFDNVSVNTEIRWYGGDPNDQNRLKYRSDIVVIDNTDLQIKDGNFKLPSKGYAFDRYYSVIEIKLRRSNDRHSDAKYNEIIQEDILKLQKIRMKTEQYNTNHDKSYFVLAFDKKKSRRLLMKVSENNENIDWDNWAV